MSSNRPDLTVGIFDLVGAVYGEQGSNPNSDYSDDEAFKDLEDSILPTPLWLERFHKFLVHTQINADCWRKVVGNEPQKIVEILQQIVFIVGFYATKKERHEIVDYQYGEDDQGNQLVGPPIFMGTLWFESNHEAGIQQARLLKVYVANSLASLRKMKSGLDKVKAQHIGRVSISDFEWPLKMKAYEDLLALQIANAEELAAYFAKISHARWNGQNHAAFLNAADKLQTKFRCTLTDLLTLVNAGLYASERPTLNLSKLRDRIKSAKTFVALNPDSKTV